MAPALGPALFASLFIGVALLTGQPCSAQENTLSDSLLGRWRFKDSTETRMPDSSGVGNDGVIFPTPAASLVQRSGAYSGALLFNGNSDQFVQIPPTPTLNTLKKQITVIALIYPTELWTPPKPPTIFNRGISKLRRDWNGLFKYIEQLFGVSFDNASDSGPTGFAAIVQRQWQETEHPDQFFLGYGPENNILHFKWHIGLMDGSDISLYCLPKGETWPKAAVWVHLAGTYDGASGQMSLYINGDLICSQIHPGEIRLDNESMSRPIMIGAELNGPSIDQGTGEFSGYIHEVRIYNRALSDSDIKVLAAQAKAEIAQ